MYLPYLPPSSSMHVMCPHPSLCLIWQRKQRYVCGGERERGESVWECEKEREIERNRVDTNHFLGGFVCGLSLRRLPFRGYFDQQCWSLSLFHTHTHTHTRTRTRTHSRMHKLLQSLSFCVCVCICDPYPPPNTGIVQGKSLLSLSPLEAERTIGVNTLGCFNTLHALLPGKPFSLTHTHISLSLSHFSYLSLSFSLFLSLSSVHFSIHTGIIKQSEKFDENGERRGAYVVTIGRCARVSVRVGMCVSVCVCVS